MPTTEQNKNLIDKQTEAQKMRNSAADTAMTANEIVGASYSLHDDIMKDVRLDRSSRGASKMAEDIGTTTGQLVQDPLDIRDRTRGIVNPEDVNALTKSARASNIGTLATQAEQASYNQGSLSEIIEAGANQLKQKAATLMAEAEREAAKADALMEALKFEQSEKEREFSEWATREQLRQSGAKGSGGSKTGYDANGNPDKEGMVGYTLGLLENSFANDPINNNVNAWDRLFRLVQGVYPWVTEGDIMDATGSPRPSGSSSPQQQQSTSVNLEPIKQTFQTGGNFRAAYSPQSLINSKIESDTSKTEALGDAWNWLKNWWNKPKTN